MKRERGKVHFALWVMGAHALCVGEHSGAMQLFVRATCSDTNTPHTVS
jgi:hypothetical protein